MTTRRIYPGRTGMHRSLSEIDATLAQKQRQFAALTPPRDPHSMLAFEQTLHHLGGEIADLHTARAIVSAHLDADFKARAAAAARRLFWDEGLLGRIDNKGWEDTTVRLRHGLVLSLRTPYLRPSRKGWTAGETHQLTT